MPTLIYVRILPSLSMRTILLSSQGLNANGVPSLRTWILTAILLQLTKGLGDLMVTETSPRPIGPSPSPFLSSQGLNANGVSSLRTWILTAIQDTLTNNLLKVSGPYIPDTIQDAVAMHHKVMELLPHCPRDRKDNIARIRDHVIRWTKRLK
jgi:hypothetical protein